MPVAARAELVRLDDLRPPARRPASRLPSTMRLDARRASRRSRRRGCPSAADRGSSSHGHMHSCPVRARPRPSPTRGAAPTPGPAARSPRSARRGAAGGTPASAAPAPTHVGQRAAADLHEDPVERRAERVLGHLPADRAAAVEAQRVLRALHAERHRARRRRPRGSGGRTDRPAGRRPRAGSRRPRPRRAACERVRATDGSAHGGTNTSSGQSTGGGQRRRRQRGVPARGDGQRRPRGRRRDAEPLGGQQVQQDRRSGDGPCGSRPTLPVSSFTQTPPSTAEAERVGEPVGPVERRDAEAGAVDRGDARRRPRARARPRRRSVMPLATRERVPRQPAPIRDERVRVVDRPQRPGPAARCAARGARSLGGGVRAPPRPRRGDVDRRPRRRRSGSR